MSSTVIAKNIQIGADGTASNNFTIFQPATPDGTLRIGNGNTGITASLVALTSAGNVGIGTSSPGSNRLYINAPDGTAPLTLNSAGGSDTTRALNFNVAGDNYGKILVPSGSGGAMAFWTGGANAAAERMRIDSSGNVGIGTSSPGYRLDVAAGDTTAGFGYAVRLRSNATAGAATLQFTDAPVSVQTGYIAVTDAGVMDFSNKVRIDSSGKLLYNCTGQTGDAPNTAGGRINETNGNEKVRVVTNGQVGFQFYSPSGGTGSPVGSVTVNASSTSYVTSSDYRLKENIAPMTGALSRVAALNPVTYTWKNTGEADEGFIAHELQEVCPSAVTGEKDAVDAEGNPVYQGIDTSFLVATLTAAIQEQQAIITALTARVTALEGAQP